MYKDQKNMHGMDPKEFEKFDLVFSGHFHHRSSRDNITYLGNPYEMTWTDFDDQRGFHFFTPESRELEFVPNPFRIFQKVFYDENNPTQNPLSEDEKNSFIKVVVTNKKDTQKFDAFIEALNNSGASEVRVLENLSDITNNEDFQLDDSIDIEDTISLLSAYVDTAETKHADKTRLKELLRSLYMESQLQTD